MSGRFPGVQAHAQLGTPAVVVCALLFAASCALPPRAGPPAARDPAVRAAEDARLQEKAQGFRAAIVDRHFTREGLFLYVVDLGRIRAQLASGHTDALADTPTHTGMFAATACTRADVEVGAGRAEALADAERALAGLELLTGVTGRPGLLARGATRAPFPSAPDPEHRWFRGAPGFEQWSWRGDASLDQYANGLLPALSACRHHFPQRARALARAAAQMLSETGMKIVDPDGRRTTYGDLSPGSGWTWNSIARLTGYGIFALAAELDGDPRWSARRDELRDRHRVVAGSKVTNVRILGITNYSNDLMAWNVYRVLVPLARRTADPALPDLLHGMARTWSRVRRDRNAYFSIVYCKLAPAWCDVELLEDARRTLLRFSPEKRRFAPAPELAALPRSLLPGRKWHPRARAIVPIELRPPDSMEWKASPYRVRAATQPDYEYTGGDYLLAYWLYRSL